MQTESQFVDNYVAALQEEQSEEVRDLWVQERLALDFMRNAKVTLRSGFAVIGLISALLWGHVQAWNVIVWAVVCALFMGYRWNVVREFERMRDDSVSQLQGYDLAAFFRRHLWSWPASAVLLALPVFFYHEKVPPITEYLCLIILVGMGAIAASLMSPNFSCQRAFSHALAGTAAVAVFVNWMIRWPSFPSRESVIFIALIGLFWVAILYVGQYLYHLQRASYSAQFGNEQLIRSLRQQTQAATEAVQMKNNLLASATHDLRQPVHALAFYADWLRNEPQMVSSVIPKILAATDSVNTLFNSLFDFSRIEAGAITTNFQDVDIERLVEEMYVQFAPAADQKGLYFRTQSLPAIVRSDSVLLRRIAANLLANAIRYTEQGGVTMTARIVGDTLWLEVNDSGVGIAPEHLPYIFKEFYRAPAHAGTADSFGLGLAIVQRLCRALGHTVTIRSVLGEGTQARIEIKLINGQAPNDSGAAGPSEPLAQQDARAHFDQIMPRARAQ